MVVMRLCICGDRHWSDWAAIVRFLEKFDRGDTMLITGGARGADQIAEEAAEALGFGARVVAEADWARYGRAAGPKRNAQMLSVIMGGPIGHDRMIAAFHDSLGTSKGTLDMIRRSQRAARANPELKIQVKLIRHRKG